MPLQDTPIVWDAILSFFSSFGITPHLYRSLSKGWRLKAKLAVRGTSNNPLIGLFQRGTHEVCSIPYCQVHHPSINRAVFILDEMIKKSKISIYDETAQRGLLRYFQLFVGRDTGLVQLGIVLNDFSLSPEVEKFCKQLDQPIWHSIWVNFQPEKNNRVLGFAWQKICGEEYLYQPLLDQIIPFHPGAFAQAHLELFESLIKTIQSWVPSNTRIVELFAGVGVIGMFLEPTCKRLLLIENNPFAELSFRARLKQSIKCEYRVQDAGQFQDFDSFDTLLVDPPRKGLGPTLLQKLSDANNLRLIYVSCGWESFQKDCQILISSGWFLEKAEGFLLFPGTNHVEILALFEKK
jgi:23S rRNA (uracil1939-C5)-methyltransferase